MAALAVLSASLASAGVVIHATRVVYPMGQPEVTVRMENQGGSPSLVQVWTDAGNTRSDPGDGGAPFVVTPPLFRLDPAKGQTIRMVFTGAGLPADRESLFWLNVLDIPPKAQTAPDGSRNLLQLTIRSRIKIFFRPRGLGASQMEGGGELTWRFVPKAGGGYALQGSNPSAYYVSLTDVTAAAGSQKWTNGAGGMLAPHESFTFDLGTLPSIPAGAKIDYHFLNDYGGPIAVSGHGAS